MILKFCGKTTDNKLVLDNVYKFQDTYGVSLTDILLLFREKYIRQAIVAGKNVKRIAQDIEIAIIDSRMFESREEIELFMEKITKIVGDLK